MARKTPSRTARNMIDLPVLDLQPAHIPVAAQIGRPNASPSWPAATLSVHGAVTREPTATTDAGPAVRATKRLITGSDHELRAGMPLPGPIAVFHPAAKSMGRAAEMRIELTGYGRPAWLAERATMRQAGIDGTLTFEPVPDGTRMRWSWHVRPKGPSKLLAPVINWMGKRQERTVWAAMKRYLEAPQPKRSLPPSLLSGPGSPASRRGEHPVGPTAAG